MECDCKEPGPCKRSGIADGGSRSNAKQEFSTENFEPEKDRWKSLDLRVKKIMPPQREA